MKVDSIPLAALNTGYGHFEIVVLPPEITIAFVVFMDLMNKVFSNELNGSISSHPNDILGYNKVFERQMQYLKPVR